MPDFAGGNSQVRIGIEALPGQPPPLTASYADLLFESAGIGAEFLLTENPNLAPGGQESEGFVGKILIEGALAGAAYPDLAFGRLVAEGQRKVTTTSPATDVYRHRMGISETNPAKSLTVRTSRDDGAPETSALAAVAGFELSVEPNSLPTFSFDMVAARLDRWGLATAPVGTVSTTKFASLRGLPSAALLALTDGDIYVKVISVAGAPTVTVKAKIGAASTYDGADISVVVGADGAGNPRWVSLTDENDAAIGTLDMPVQVAITTATGLAANDVFRFNRESATWTTVGPTMLAFNEIYCEITIDEEVFCLTSFTLSAAFPVAVKECIGGRFAEGLDRSGTREVRISIERKYTDRRIVDKLISGTPFALKATLSNGQDVEAGFPYLLVITCPRCRATSKAPEARQDLTESVEFSCFRSPGDASGFVDDLTIELQNAEPTLIA